jgi:pilus assembly protein CpaC
MGARLIAASVMLMAALLGTPEEAGESSKPASDSVARKAPCFGRWRGEFEPEDNTTQALSLSRGTQRVLRFQGLRGVAVEDEEIVGIRFLGQEQLLVTASDSGRSRLIVYREKRPPLHFEVVVTTGELDSCILCELCKLLDRHDTVCMRVVGDRIFLDGEMSSVGEVERVRNVSAMYPGVVIWAKPSERLLQSVVRDIDVALIRAGYPRLKARLRGNEIALDGTIRADQDFEKAHLIAEHLFEPVASFSP